MTPLYLLSTDNGQQAYVPRNVPLIAYFDYVAILLGEVILVVTGVSARDLAEAALGGVEGMKVKDIAIADHTMTKAAVIQGGLWINKDGQVTGSAAGVTLRRLQDLRPPNPSQGPEPPAQGCTACGSTSTEHICRGDPADMGAGGI
jgi:hypothetical protein